MAGCGCRIDPSTGPTARSQTTRVDCADGSAKSSRSCHVASHCSRCHSCQCLPLLTLHVRRPDLTESPLTVSNWRRNKTVTRCNEIYQCCSSARSVLLSSSAREINLWTGVKVCVSTVATFCMTVFSCGTLDNSFDRQLSLSVHKYQ